MRTDRKTRHTRTWPAAGIALLLTLAALLAACSGAAGDQPTDGTLTGERYTQSALGIDYGEQNGRRCYFSQTDTGDDRPYAIQVADFRFAGNRYWNIWVQDGEELLLLPDAYLQGILREQDVQRLADIHYSYMRSLQPGKTDAQFRKEYNEIGLIAFYRQEDMDKAPDDPLSPTPGVAREIKTAFFEAYRCLIPPDFYTLCSYGAYNGAYAVLVGGTDIDYTANIVYRTVGDCLFIYSSSHEMDLYFQGSFYTLTEAYERGILSDADLQALCRTYRAANAGLYEELPEE